MPIRTDNGDISIVHLSMNVNEFPEFLQIGLDNDPSPEGIEGSGQALINCNFEEQPTVNFIEEVCAWGRRLGVATNLFTYEGNTHEHVSDTMRAAYEQTLQGQPVVALETLAGLTGLGVSFASKHLRMLCPDQHVVLDSRIRERIGYPKTPDGYREFVSECASIRDIVNESKVTRPNGQPFRIADIEMAIYHKIRDGR